MSPAPVAVLGASGLIGSAVTAALAARGRPLRLVARRPCLPPPGAVAEVLAADLTAPGVLAEAVAGAAAVVNLVAHTPGARSWRLAEADAEAERVNAGLLNDLAGVLRGTHERPPVVLLASTVVQQGAQRSPYVRQKLRAERALRAATRAGTLTGATLRLSTVYGHGPATVRDRGVLATMIRRALRGEPLTMWHDGTVYRDLLHARDAGEAFAAALEHPEPLAGRSWAIGSGASRPLGEVFTEIAGLVGAWQDKPPVPVLQVEPPPGAQAGDFHSTFVDSTAFRAATGWQPRTSLAEGLADTVAALAAEED